MSQCVLVAQRMLSKFSTNFIAKLKTTSVALNYVQIVYNLLIIQWDRGSIWHGHHFPEFFDKKWHISME